MLFVDTQNQRLGPAKVITQVGRVLYAAGKSNVKLPCAQSAKQFARIGLRNRDMRIEWALFSKLEQRLRPELALHGVDSSEIDRGVFSAKRFFGKHTRPVEAAQGAGNAV